MVDRYRQDRTVHASMPGLTGGRIEIVRYDRAGKWYVEYADGSRRHISLNDAVAMADQIHGKGGTIHWARSGGTLFDSRLRARGVLPRAAVI